MSEIQNQGYATVASSQLEGKPHAKNSSAALRSVFTRPSPVLALGQITLLACSSGTATRQTPVRENATSSRPMAAGADARVAASAAGYGAIDNPGTLPIATITTPMTMTTAGAGAHPADGCVGSSVSAPPASNPKVDIVWVVDASGSMLDEQMKIGANLTAFANEISQASIDVRIVMLTTLSTAAVICPSITEADPLATTPLASDPRYKFIDSAVDSYNLLDIAVDRYSTYADFLRKDAALNFVMVTDDESTYKRQTTPEARASAFQADMKMLAGKDFALHTISSDGPPPCRPDNCMPDRDAGVCALLTSCGAAAPGTTYYTLAESTHGLTASICESDWQSIFQPLTAAVIKSAPLPCSYNVPAPPRGESLDPKRVNVRWLAPAMTSDVLWPRATTSAECGEALGWYYDDPNAPKQVLLCPRSCETASNGGTISLSFGCVTIELK